MFYPHFPFLPSVEENLDHTLNKLVDLLSTVSSLTSLKEVNKLGLVGESTTGAGKLEGPQEVVSFLEVRSNGANLVDEVGTALDTNRSDSLLNNRVVGNGDTLLVELSESTLVDELLNSRAGGVAVGYVRLNETKHTDGRLVELDEASVVDLTKTEELHDLLGLG